MGFGDWLYKAVIVQMICVVIIVLGVVGMKYFFEDKYKEFERFYVDNLNCDTNIQEVLEDEI